jgi:hypothetical protein
MVGEVCATRVKVLVALARLKEAGCMLSMQRALSVAWRCCSSGACLGTVRLEVKCRSAGSQWRTRVAVPTALVAQKLAGAQ